MFAGNHQTVFSAAFSTVYYNYSRIQIVALERMYTFYQQTNVSHSIQLLLFLLLMILFLF